MEFLDKLIESEQKYIELSSIKEEQNSYIRYTDNIFPDMPMHNFTYVKRHSTFEETKQLVLMEKERLVKDSLKFVRIVFDTYAPFSGEMPEFSNFTYVNHSILTFNLEKFQNEYADNNCFPVQEFHLKQLQELYQNIHIGVAHNEQQHSKWINFKLRTQNLSTIVYSRENLFLGSCELFYNNNIVKLEDFEILEEYRNKNIGKTLLKSALSIAKSSGIKTLYLITDRNDWLLDYYIHCGFVLFAEYNSCTLYR